jgi:hypothetical protein
MKEREMEFQVDVFFFSGRTSPRLVAKANNVNNDITNRNAFSDEDDDDDDDEDGSTADYSHVNYKAVRRQLNQQTVNKIDNDNDNDNDDDNGNDDDDEKGNDNDDNDENDNNEQVADLDQAIEKVDDADDDDDDDDDNNVSAGTNAYRTALTTATLRSPLSKHSIAIYINC